MLDSLARLQRWERQINQALNDRPTKASRSSRSAEQARATAEESGATAPIFPEFFSDPVGFATSIGVRLWRKQKRILLAIAKKAKVAIRSGQKTGKTTAFVVAALWWAATRPLGRVLLTAPGNKQVRNVLWKELRRIVYSKAPDGRRVYEILGVEPALVPSTGMQWPDGREIIGFAADVPENMQGFSGPEMLTLVDEGSGVSDDIFEAIDGNSAGGGHIATASQPTKQSGWFFDAFHSKAEFWDPHVLSSEETPNVTGEEEPIPGLASPAKIAEWKREHARDSQFYLVRVLGQFAKAAANAVIALTHIDDAKRRWEEREDAPTDPLELGVDCARFGDDDTSIAARRGRHMFPLKSFNGADTNAIVAKVMEVVREHRPSGSSEPKAIVKIDSTGGYGAGPADVLRAEYWREVIVCEVNSSTKADDEDAYFNLRSQLHFAMAEWLKDGGELPPDTKLEGDLLAPTYSFDARRRKKVESKDEIKKRLKRSPDRGDGAMLSVYSAPTGGSPKVVHGIGSRYEDTRGWG